MVVRCNVNLRLSPLWKWVNVRSKHVVLGDYQQVKEDAGTSGETLHRPSTQKATHASFLLSLSPEITALHEVLAKVAVLTVCLCFMTDNMLERVFLNVIKLSIAGSLMPVNDNMFLVPLTSREDVEEICKMGSFKISTKEGDCSLKLAPWSTELGAYRRTSG